MLITSFFADSGNPKTGLTPTIQIVNAATGTIVISAASMTEISAANAPGWYRYDFTTYDDSVDYTMTADGGSVLKPTDRYVYGGNDLGQVTEAIDNLNDIDGTDVQAAMTAQGYTTTRAIYLDELGPTNLPADIDAILADTSAIDARLPSDPADQSDVEAAITASETNIRGTDGDDLKTISDQIDALPTLSGIATEVWSESLPGTYGIGEAGKLVGDNLDAAVSTRATPAQVKSQADQALIDYDPPTKAELDAAEAAIRGTDGDDLKTISDQIDDVALEANIEAHVQSAMTAQGYTTTRAANLDNLDVAVSAAKTSSDIAKALVHENTVMDEHDWHSYGGAKYLKSARLRHYDSKANAQAAGVIGLLYVFSIYAEYTDDQQTLFRIVREGS